MSMKARDRSRTRPGERGQVVVIVAIFMVVLIGFSALAVDYGSYLIARRSYQNIADAAALAGSVHMSRPIDDTKRGSARAAAWDSLARQLALSGPFPSSDTGAGSPHQEGGWSIWVTTPPTAAGSKYPGSSNISGSASVFVRVEKDNPAFLSRMFGINGRNITAWATAGNAPSRWAVLALCGRNGACPPNAQSVTLAGATTALRVVDGDLGGNWGMAIQGNSPDRLQLPGDSQAYLVDATCGPSLFLCYPNPNVGDGSGGAKEVRTLPAPVEDPNYPLPPWLTDATAVPTRPDVGPPPLTGGTIISPTTENVGCTPSSPRIGPGRYTNIRIGANSCVILDPTSGLTAGQRPGIYYITGQLDIGSGSFIVGDGVSLFFGPSMNAFNPQGGVVINVGNSDTSIPSGQWKYGAWTTKGLSGWSIAAGSPPTSTWTTPTDQEVGVAFYVLRDGGSYTTRFNMSGATPILFRGILYGPQDNVNIGGVGTQAAVGQIVGWTVRYNGTTTIEQVFDGPSEARSFLLEPRTGQPD